MSVKVNEYFEGKVKSLSVENSAGKQTVGVMVAGEYEFGTGSAEEMTLVSGKWELQIPGVAGGFKSYAVGQTANIPANSKFQLKILETSAYLCRFE
ncbi:MAG TPA: pyrimidine/purine nucleoside phosphorylase [Fibrobacteria bacterium]|nr:pyrimidine/purine nucleoside phosphorylase [Fibrobacteria bacterium]HOX51892.1 pyrimidine/purine nucleoside phosphorylase [Fibrobacteria bacterium]